MPWGDRTGPYGASHMTGRGAGYCAGFNVPGYVNPAVCRGFLGIGRAFGGRGYRFKHWFYATGLPGWMRFGFAAQPCAPIEYSKEDEKSFLKQQVDYLTQTIEQLNKRLSELETKE